MGLSLLAADDDKEIIVVCIALEGHGAMQDRQRSQAQRRCLRTNNAPV